MTTITIPKKLIREKELVIIPRREYEKLLQTARMKKKHVYTQLDKDLDEAIAEYKAGKFFGPFNTVKEGIKLLEREKVSKTKK